MNPNDTPEQQQRFQGCHRLSDDGPWRESNFNFGGGGVDGDTHGLAVASRCGAADLPAQVHEPSGNGARASQAKTVKIRPATNLFLRDDRWADAAVVRTMMGGWGAM